MGKRIKKSNTFLALVLIGSILFGSITVAYGAEIPKSIIIGSETLDIKETKVYEKNGYIMLPLRYTAEKLGYEVLWKGDTQEVQLTKGAQWTSIKLGEDKYFFARMAPYPLGMAPEAKESRTYVPIEFFREILKYNVELKDGNIVIQEIKGENLPKYFVGDSFILKGEKDEKLYISDYKQFDINGDNTLDHVILAGKKEREDSIYFTDVKVIVEDGKTGEFIKTEISPDAGGYEPSIFAGDFNNDKVTDILISLPTGGSGGIIQYALLTFKEDKLVPLFDFNAFNQGFDYKVKFLPDFKAEISSESLGKNEVLDLTYNKETYMELGIYNKDGDLKIETEGWVDGYGMLKPYDEDGDGNYELQGIQRISGCCHADSLGHIITNWKWNGKEFELDSIKIDKDIE